MKVQKFKIFNDQEGSLLPIDFFHIPFEPKRAFVVTGVPKGEERGNHAHFSCQQFLICVKGAIMLRLKYDLGESEEELLLPGDGVLVDKMIWDSQVFETGNDVLLVLSSEFYDPDDYIHDFGEFIKLK